MTRGTVQRWQWSITQTKKKLSDNQRSHTPTAEDSRSPLGKNKTVPVYDPWDRPEVAIWYIVMAEVYYSHTKKLSDNRRSSTPTAEDSPSPWGKNKTVPVYDPWDHSRGGNWVHCKAGVVYYSYQKYLTLI